MTTMRREQHKGKKMEVCIREDADTIVDLADTDAVNKISMKSKKSKNKKTGNNNDEDEKIDFRVAADGRLIIEEPKKKRGKKEFKPQTEKKENGKRPLAGSDSESEVDDDVKTQRSVQHVRKKQKGIYRNTNSNASVASGRTGKSFVTMKSQKSSQSFKSGKGGSKAARAERKMEGKKQTMQPYAYIPLRPHKGQKKKGRR